MEKLCWKIKAYIISLVNFDPGIVIHIMIYPGFNSETLIQKKMISRQKADPVKILFPKTKKNVSSKACKNLQHCSQIDNIFLKAGLTS
jgi:hypothetical protein